MENQYGNINAYDIVTRSLRETLMPAYDYMTHVKAFEDRPDYGLYVSEPEEFTQNGDRMYVAPYPYKRSAFDAIVQAKVKALGTSHVTFEHEDAIRWRDLVMQRSSGIMHNAISESNMIALDANGDCGVFLNTSDGNIYPFMYSAISGVNILSYPHLPMSTLLSCAYSRDPDMSGYEQSQTYYQHFIRDNTAYLQFQYDTPNGDCFRCANEVIKLTTFAPYSDDDLDCIEKYIHTAIDNHTKVILVP